MVLHARHLHIGVASRWGSAALGCGCFTCSPVLPQSACILCCFKSNACFAEVVVMLDCYYNYCIYIIDNLAPCVLNTCNILYIVGNNFRDFLVLLCSVIKMFMKSQ